MRGRLRAREHWTRAALDADQASDLAILRAFAYERSPFYRRFHAGLFDRPLAELPVLTKGLLMEHFDELVTDRAVQLVDVEAHLASMTGDGRFRDRYRVVSTSGTTGVRGIFLSDPVEWATVIASYNRAQEWAGVVASPVRRMRLAVVSTTTAWHQSARVGASVRNPLIRTLRVNATDPLSSVVARLNEFQPQSLVAYASMHRLLAEEQLAGRLRIAPDAVMSASEVLTDTTRRLVEAAWARLPFNVYAATETAGIASECERHTGLHLYEDLVITEVVDEANRPVPADEFGAKILVTVLFSRTQPLIRYELSDSVRPSGIRCPCGRPFGLLDGIQGRREDVLELPARGGGTVRIHPLVFHDVLDRVPAGEWQVIQDGPAIRLLVAGPSRDFDGVAVVSAIRRGVESLGASVDDVTWQEVAAIPRTAVGKAPLVRADPAAHGWPSVANQAEQSLVDGGASRRHC
jgi:putative adenylate-forming enzyme